MMDLNGHYEMRRQHYQDMLREAEENRLARELGFTETNTLHSLAAKFWGWLSQRPVPRIASNDDSLIRRTRYDG